MPHRPRLHTLDTGAEACIVGGGPISLLSAMGAVPAIPITGVGGARTVPLDSGFLVIDPRKLLSSISQVAHTQVTHKLRGEKRKQWLARSVFIALTQRWFAFCSERRFYSGPIT